MSDKIIWYLHHYAGSPSLGMAYRPYYLARAFNQKGYRAYVIGASFHHLKKNTTKIKEPVCFQVVDEQDYVFLKTPEYHGNGIKRLLNMFAYSWRFWRSYRDIEKKTGTPSVIIVSSGHPFHYIPAWILARKHGAKLLFEVRDLWPLSFIELLHVSAYHPIVLLMGMIEQLAYKTADQVVSLLPHAFPYMQSRGLTQERFCCIPNGIDVAGSKKIKQPLPLNYQEQINGLKKQNLFLVGYAGSHGTPNALDDLLHALLLLKQQGHRSIHAVLIGQGEQKTALQSFAQREGLDNVTFLDPLPRSQLLSFLDAMDILYIGWKDSPIYRFGISPNKIFEYMLAQKPILHAFSIDQDIVSENGCGMRVDAENPAAIAEGLKAMHQKNPEEMAQYSACCSNTVNLCYDYDRLADQYIRLFE